MKKTLVVVFLIVVLSIVFYVSVRNQKNKKLIIPQEPLKQISLYHYFSGSFSGGISEMIDEVNTGQSEFNVTARALDHEAFKSMILTTLDKGNPPELFSYWAGARVKDLVKQDKLEPIDDIWENEKFNTRFPQSVIDSACTYNGHKYVLPINQFIVLFFYNKQVFKKYNMSPPDTWDEFLNICKTLKQNNITPLALGSRERWPAQFWLDYMLLRSQGVEYRNRLMNGNAGYTDDAVKDVYRKWSELLQNGYFNKNANDLDWAEATGLVCEGKSAMTLMGSWVFQVFENNELCQAGVGGFDFFTFPVMNRDIPKVALGPIDGIVLSKNSVNHEFAKKILVYFAGKKPQERLSLGSGGLSPSLEVPLSFYPPIKIRMIEEIKSSKAWAFNYDLATPPPVAELGMNSFQELIEFPDQYEAILENLETEARSYFNKVGTVSE